MIWTTGTPAALNSLAVIGRGLVAFDDENCQRVPQFPHRALKQRRLARARAADEVESQDFAAGEPCPVARRERGVLRQHIPLKKDCRGMAVNMVMIVNMVMKMAVVMEMSMVMRVAVIV